MKKYLLLIGFAAVILYGCKKNDVKVDNQVSITGKWVVKADTSRSYHPGNALPFSTFVVYNAIGDTYQLNADGTGTFVSPNNNTSTTLTYNVANGAITINYALIGSSPYTSKAIIKKMTTNELILYYENIEGSNPRVKEFVYLTR